MRQQQDTKNTPDLETLCSADESQMITHQNILLLSTETEDESGDRNTDGEETTKAATGEGKQSEGRSLSQPCSNAKPVWMRMYVDACKGSGAAVAI